MAFEMLVGLNVSDDRLYGEYRKAMTPLLRSYGGDFGYDFKVNQVLKSEVEHEINRVFTIRFPDEETKERFFLDPKYKLAKETFYWVSVKDTAIIAQYRT